MIRMFALTALAAVSLAVPAVASAQQINFASEANKVWWNYLDEMELRELADEAGATWVNRPDTETERVSVLRWPGVPDVEVREINCIRNDETVENPPIAERACGGMRLIARSGIAAENQFDVYAVARRSWLGLIILDGDIGFERLEVHTIGTTRGRVLGTLLQFKLTLTEEMRRLERYED